MACGTIGTAPQGIDQPGEARFTMAGPYQRLDCKGALKRDVSDARGESPILRLEGTIRRKKKTYTNNS